MNLKNNNMRAEDVVGRITILISKGLKASQENKDKKSSEYLLGQNDAYSKVLEEITLTLTNDLYKKLK
tara:strand:- start:556 stop:759 length:204 start_codon:yes stop_codon:yes gene_type:complete